MHKSCKFKFNSDKAFIPLVIIFIILTFILFYMIFNTPDDYNDNKELMQIYNYFNTKDVANCEGLKIYSDSTVNYENLDLETKFCLAYYKSNFEAENNELKSEKNSETCIYGEMVFRKAEKSQNCNYKKIKKSVINETYNEIFGKSIDEFESLKFDNLNICYSKDEYYYCGLSETLVYTIGSESTVYRIIKNVKEKGSKLVIHDIFIKSKDEDCYENYTTATKLNKCSKTINYKFINKYGSEYKHTFKKNNNGDYYWVSTTPVS